ncbi:DUF6603 domain-containing protein [Chitinophaga ginsengisoli]|uniref:DUF6603 domain-containing protein n=1 Tax=Chitinophaga ginsengisoli TaxID=363837 RepID=A0A2P8GMA6_9BACT|nr:DUF6603 domain-containing protein [Chitinophaga ginsengisoli]PSL35076.1 hypothetical protein CLV42_102650 [Chitinophaga ginsengisoli]
MADNKNLLQQYVKIARDILNPFVDMLGGTLEDRKEGLASLGLDPSFANSSPAVPTASLNSINQYVEKSADEVDEIAFFAVLEDLIQISAVIKEFFEAASAGNPNLTASELTTSYMNLLTLNYFRLRAPMFFKVMSIIESVDQQSVRSGGILNLFGAIGKFFENVGEGFKLENEDHARNLSDTMLFVGGVGLTLLNKLFFHFSIPLSVDAAYGYDTYPASTSPNADMLSQRTLSFSIKHEADTVESKLTNTLVLVPLSQQGKAAVMDITGEIKIELDLGNHWKFTFDTGGLGIIFRVGEGADASLATNPFVEMILENNTDEVTKGTLFANPVMKFGYGRIKTSIRFSKDDIEFKFKPTIAFEFGRGTKTSFPFTLIPKKGLDQKIDIAIGISQKKGFFLDGGANGLTIALPVYATLGPVSFDVITLAYSSDEATQEKQIEVSVSFKLKIGSVIAATVSRTGVLAKLNKNPAGEGAIAGYDIDFSFKPPNGIGIAVDAGVVTGGGFLYFDSKAGEYFGALELSFKNLFTFKAIGIINTKMPDGSDGYSLLIIVTASGFSFQLGFGFTLNGLGGLLGLNRTIKVDVLVDGLKTNTLKSILFPEDVVANINRIISDLKQVFPIQQDHFVVGLMAKIGWGTPTLVTLDLGVIVDFPDPRVVILGVLKAVLPKEEAPVLKLQINFVGIIDIPNSFIFFRADLYDSRLLVFTLTGSLALLVAWGDNATFALSVGGFHPDFHDIPSIPQLPNGFKNLDRLGISLLSGENPRITIQCYFAVTSNTVQFGAKAELYAEAAGFNVYGYLGFDVLFQFEPFHFVAKLYAGLALRHGTSVIKGITLSGELSGPKPWDVKGEASFSILFFDVSIGFHVTWGDDPDAVAKITEDLQQLMIDEINNNQNWQAVIPDNNKLHVSVKDLKLIQPEDNPSPNIVIHPLGVLTFSERVLPMEVTIQKFGTRVPKDVDLFKINGVKTGTTNLTYASATERFAPANFFNLKDNEKLSRRSFETNVSGCKVTASADLSIAPAVNKSVDYELSYLRKKRFSLFFAGIYKYSKSLFRSNLKGSAVAASKMSYATNRQSVNAPDAVAVQKDQYVVANVSDMKMHSAGMVANSYAEAVEMYNTLTAKQPALKNKVQILSQYEINNN